MKKLILVFSVILGLFLLGACGNSDKTSSNQDNQKADKDLEAAKAKFAPLGDMPIPDDNALTDEKIELGNKLFFDPRLSGNNKLSCASCHATGAAFGDGLKTFIGFNGFKGPRNSPTIINAGYYEDYFWDGRADSLEAQALGPIQAEHEMNSNLDQLIKELNGVPAYVSDFKNVFDDKITADTIAKAIASFERTIVIKDTAFDQYLKGDDNAISDEAKEGMKVFAGKANCISCHAGATLSDNSYHNLGMTGDDGRFAVTNDKADKGKIRTPALRGVAHTAPYMHDGSLATLEDVVNYYNQGGGNDTNKDSLIQPLNLTDEEVSALVAFLESMSGEVPEVSKSEIPL
ncbi:cytochrome-c peroxidase [Cytobacillus sp. Hz8]|uniref:cytochrome-c peroxidase n=1 Tax=Cytobacillus sp. Hz8 TaxID=3347168 RepID=UPI0035D68210